jgi:NAD(P)-dependent dehydrogenase (short-subunit alcohol dehydrogenase family)
MGSTSDERRVVIVTGGSDGIGAAAARMLAGGGDEVVVVGRSPGKTRAVAAQLGAECHVADFADLDQVRDLAGELRARLGVNSPFRLAMRSPERGADTLVWLATSAPGTDWDSGGYFADRMPAAASPAAGDGNLAGELWDRSAQMCGLEPYAAGPQRPGTR